MRSAATVRIGDRAVPYPAARGQAELTIAGAALIGDCAGVLYWPDQQILAVADLHLEKGSAFAARGVLLPPYDTASTLKRLAALIAYYSPRLVIALGDSFHDGGGPDRLSDADRSGLTAMQRGRDWLWITGNHDPDPAEGIGGRFTAELAICPLIFRHEPATGDGSGEIAGHLHPSARLARRGRAVTRRCFAANGARLIMPAFGAYAGGLNIRSGAILDVFGTLAFTAHMLGRDRLYTVAAAQCLQD
jgi:hypothetical protein